MNPELALLNRFNDIRTEHKMLNVGLRNQNSLIAGQPALLADIKESLNLLVDTADGLHFAPLIDRSGDCKSLLNRYFRQC